MLARHGEGHFKSPYSNYYVYERRLFKLCSTYELSDADLFLNPGFVKGPDVVIDGEDLYIINIDLDEIVAGDLIFAADRIRKTREDVSTYICYGGIMRTFYDKCEAGMPIESHYVVFNPGKQRTEMSEGPCWIFKER